MPFLTPDESSLSLAALLQVANAVTSNLDLIRLLEAVCASVVKSLQADHSAFALFSQDGASAEVLAEAPAGFGAAGIVVPLRGVPALERMLETRVPLSIDDVERLLWESPLGQVRQILTELRLRSLIVVPVICRDKVIGSLSVAAAGAPRSFSEPDIATCQAYAALAASAINNAQLFQSVQTRTDAVLATIKQISSVLDPEEMLRALVAHSVALMNAQSGGLYKYDAPTATLTVVASHNRPQHLGKTLKLGEGIAGRMVLEQRRVEIVHDYSADARKASIYGDDRQFGSVLEVLLSSGDDTFGVLYVDDHVGRIFTPADAQALQMLAEHALVAWLNADRFARLREEAMVREIADNLAGASHISEGLQILAEQLPEALAASFCRVLVREDSESSGGATGASYLVAAGGGKIADWNPRLGKPVDSLSALEIQAMLALKPRAILQRTEEADRTYLDSVAAGLELKSELQVLALVPLVIGPRTLGLLEIGKIVPDIYPHALRDKYHLAQQVAAQTALFIDRMRLLEKEARRGRLRADLEAKSQHIRAEKEWSKLCQEGVRLGVELIHGVAGALYIYHQERDELELIAEHDWPEAGASMRLAGGGIAGRVVVENKSILEAAERAPARRARLAIPLRKAGDPHMVLVVETEGEPAPLPQFELETLERFGARLASALETASQLRPGWMSGRMAVLRSLTRYLLASDDSRKIMHAVLNVITAGYGFGLNRAGFLLLGSDGQTLDGQAAVGQFHEEEKAVAWAEIEASPVDLRQFLNRLDRGEYPDTAVGRKIGGLHLSMGAAAGDAFSRVIAERRPIATAPEKLPETFRNFLLPESDVLLVPLLTPGAAIGVLFADTKFSRNELTESDLEALEMLANLTALTLERLLARPQDNLAEVRGLLKMPDPEFPAGAETGLREALERFCSAAGAAGASLIFVEENRAVGLVTAGADRPMDLDTVVRPQGLSVHALQAGKPVMVAGYHLERSKLNPITARNDYQSSICLPVTGPDGPIGVIWLHYFVEQSFSELRTGTLMLYAQRIALAYESARRVEDENALLIAATRLSACTTARQTAAEIVQTARQMFAADLCTFWPYSQILNRFTRDDAAVAGDNVRLEDLQEPRLGRTSYQILNLGYHCEERLPQVEEASLERIPETHRVAERFGIQSYQAVVLRTGEEILGVLYVSYRRPRRFRRRARRALEESARMAALSLKRVRLGDQLARARKAVGAVAGALIAPDTTGALNAIAQGGRSATGCDVVTVYSYDAARRKFGYPPGMAGVEDVTGVLSKGRVAANTLLGFVVQQDRPYVVPNAATDRIFANSGFTTREKIVSCVAAPLFVETEKVGVLFLNYRAPREFSTDELSDIRLIASHAALAIRNSQQRERILRDAARLESLSRLSQELLAAESAHDAADRAARFAAQELGADYSAVIAEQDGRLLYLAGVKWEDAFRKNLEFRRGADTHAGYAIVERRPVIVENFAEPQPFEVHERIRRQKIQSGAAVPLRLKSQVIGALTVHTTEARVFDDADISFLTLIAHQTAIALTTVRRFENLLQRREKLGVVASVLKAIAAEPSAPREPQFDGILKAAVDMVTAGAGGTPDITGAILVHDRENHRLVSRSVYPRDAARVLSIDLNRSPIGIAGRTFLEAQPRIVANVAGDADYIEADPLTRSEIAVPILENGLPSGVLNLECPRVSAFQQADLDLLNVLAEAAAVSLHNAELEQNFAQAAQSVEKQNELLAVVAHELRAPLNTMEYFTRSLVKDTASLLDGKQKRRLEIAHSTANEALRIVENLLFEYRNTEAGPNTVSLGQILRECAERFQWLTDRKRIAFSCSILQEELLDVAAGELGLRIVFNNLISNAVRATRGGGSVTVRAQLAGQGDSIEVSVRDTGSGIPAEEREKIFAKYYRIGGAMADSGGTGLGLYIVKQQLDRYKGTIQVDSGETGSTFVVMLPRWKGQAGMAGGVTG